jgi:hypothetical protein
MATTTTPRPRCRHCTCPATKAHPLTNGYCSSARATAAILNRMTFVA